MAPKIRAAFSVLCLAVTCWYGMMLVHESGHMLAAVVTGTTIQRLEFPLLGFSRTDVTTNSHALTIAWCGPLIGAIAPLATLGLFQVLKLESYTLKVFAAFSLLANGCYIGLGSFERIGDAGDMLRSGSSPWTLWLFGAAASTAGFWICHRLGRRFGIEHLRKSDLKAATVAAVLLILLTLFVQNER